MAESKKTSILETVNENRGIISAAVMLWGASSLVSGVVTTYTTTAYVVANSAMKAAPAILAPYLLTIAAGAFNLLFGIALISIGLKIRK